MKKSVRNGIIFGVFAVVFILGIFWLVTRRPEVYVGTVSIISAKDEVKLDGYKSVSLFKDDKENFNYPKLSEITKKDLPVFNQSKKQLVDSLVNPESSSPTIETTPAESESPDTTGFDVGTQSAMRVKGRNVDKDLTYNVYDMDGKLLKTANKLTIPVEKLAGSEKQQIDTTVENYIVEVVVKWGREKNYEEYRYYFKCVVK